MCPGGTLITKAAFIQESRVGILILISMSSVETDPSHQIEYGFQEDFLSISFSDCKDVVMDLTGEAYYCNHPSMKAMFIFLLFNFHCQK